METNTSQHDAAPILSIWKSDSFSFFSANVRHFKNPQSLLNLQHSYPKMATISCTPGKEQTKWWQKDETDFVGGRKNEGEAALAMFALDTWTACNHQVNWLSCCVLILCLLVKWRLYFPVQVHFWKSSALLQEVQRCLCRTWHSCVFHRAQHSQQTAWKPTQKRWVTTEKENSLHISYAIQKAERNKGQ